MGARLGDEAPRRCEEQRRERGGAPRELPERRAQEHARRERLAMRLALDEHPAHLERRDAVRETGRDEAAELTPT